MDENIQESILKLKDSLESAFAKIAAHRKFVDVFIFHYFLMQPETEKEFNQFQSTFLPGFRKLLTADKMDGQILSELEQIFETLDKAVKNKELYLSLADGEDSPLKMYEDIIKLIG